MTKSLWFCILTLQVLSARDDSFSLPDAAYGWKKSGTTDVYAGEELFRLIDGGADIFFEYGFKKVIVQRYAGRNNNFVDVEIYEMNDSSSAYGIFSLFTFTTGKQTDSLAEAFTGDQFLLFRKGNYYVSLTGLNSLKETQEGLFLIAKEIAGKISESGVPPLVSLFDQMISEAPRSKRAYIKGNLGLYNLSTISFGTVFKVEEGICLEAGGVKNFIFGYGNNDICSKNYSAATESLKKNSTYTLHYSKPFAALFAGQKNYLQCLRAGKYIVVSISENKTDLEINSEKVEGILQKQY